MSGIRDVNANLDETPLLALSKRRTGLHRRCQPLSMHEPSGFDVQYRAVAGLKRGGVKREIELLAQLAREVDPRLPAGLSDRERELRAQEIVDADPVLRRLASELMELSEGRAEPPIWERLFENPDNL